MEAILFYLCKREILYFCNFERPFEPCPNFRWGIVKHISPLFPVLALDFQVSSGFTLTKGLPLNILEQMEIEIGRHSALKTILRAGCDGSRL